MKKILGLDLGTTSIGWALTYSSKKVGQKNSFVQLPKSKSQQTLV